MKDSILHTRINKELLEQLKAKAKEENRTVSNLVETIIKNHLQENRNDLKCNKRFEIKRWNNEYKEYTNSIYVDTEEEIAKYYEHCKSSGYTNDLMIIDKSDNSISYYN